MIQIDGIIAAVHNVGPLEFNFFFDQFQIAFASCLDRYHSARRWHRPGGCQI